MKLFYDDKKIFGSVFRRMWCCIFEDPQTYEDFYFQTIYPKNCVLAAQKGNTIVGMIHLNPYQMYINGNQHSLHYIVGVATRNEFRRQGIMRRMLVTCMRDMADAGEVFTYLMPADQAYYEPFDFVFIQKFYTERKDGIKGETHVLELPEESYWQAADYIDLYLKKHYQVFTSVDVDYLEQLHLECMAENGGLLIYKQNNCLNGFCCYGQDENGVYVRQIFAEDINAFVRDLQRYFQDQKIEFTFDGSKTDSSEAIMARILRLDLLFPLLKSSAICSFIINIEDSYLEHQNGSFQIWLDKMGCRIERTAQTSDRSITIQDLTKILFGFECSHLFTQYPEFRSILPLAPTMIGEIV